MERSWDFREWGFAPDEYDRMHHLAVTQYDMIRTMPVILGAADALWRLSDAGIWLRIITHRLYVNWAHERAVGDTAAWLDEHRIPYRDLCFLGAKPEVQADAYIDDAPHNITALRELGNTVIVFDQPYNRHLTDGPWRRTGRKWSPSSPTSPRSTSATWRCNSRASTPAVVACTTAVGRETEGAGGPHSRRRHVAPATGG